MLINDKEARQTDMKLTAATVLLIFLWVGSLLGNDAIAASVSVSGPCTQPDAIVYNGNPYSSGTYAVGTIQILYVVVADQFPVSSFGCFDLTLQDIRVADKNLPDYPVTLNLRQTGSANLQLTPAAFSFVVSGLGGVQGTPVSVNISIPAGVHTDPSLNGDGAELVGNLQLETDPKGSKLGTVTTIQVKIKLVHPTQCLKTYHYILDNDTLQVLSSLVVNIGDHGPNKDKVISSNPGVIFDAVLLVNTCAAPQTFDLSLLKSAFFDLGGNGNQVFSYTKAGAEDLSEFLSTGLPTGTPHQLNLCLENLSLSGNTAMLVTDKLKIVSGTAKTDLPATPPGFTFSAELSGPNTSCGGSPLSASVVSPNPNPINLTYSLK